MVNGRTTMSKELKKEIRKHFDEDKALWYEQMYDKINNEYKDKYRGDFEEGIELYEHIDPHPFYTMNKKDKE